MSQPFDRAALIPAPRKADSRLKDWWVENPWRITTQGKSLSGYERNRVFLNSQGRTFYEISALTGADSDGDGRSVVSTDFNNDGMEDLIVRQAGGGPVLVFENKFPKANWLKVTLRGTQSQRQGVGARLVSTVGNRKIVRELYPSHGFKAQGSGYAHFGLGTATEVGQLTVTWPSGRIQEFNRVPANSEVRITEGSAEIQIRNPQNR